MIETRFWSNKAYVENWLEDIPHNCSISTLGRGHRGVKLWLHDKSITVEQFIEKYSGTDSIYGSFYLTANHITKENPIYVSIRKFGYNYGCKYPFKSKN